MMALLRIVRGPVSGTLLPLADEQGVIGRSPCCQVVLPDPTVSRRHARISRSPDGFLLEPLVGYNATYLNDQRMSGSRPLRDGDRIRLGGTEMVFESRDAVGPPGEGGPRETIMTESQWRSCREPEAMFVFLWDGGKLPERKGRLFAAACCRRIWGVITEPCGREAATTAERYADGQASLEELEAAFAAADRAFASGLQGGLRAWNALDATRLAAHPEIRGLADGTATAAAMAAGEGDETWYYDLGVEKYESGLGPSGAVLAVDFRGGKVFDVRKVVH
jgi:pSer/pThr/pTyr-binding forkhead associated (FHA) protein